MTRKSGTTENLTARLMAKVVKLPGEDGCWEWTGALNDGGYGVMSIGSRGAGTDRTHRVSFRLFKGKIPRRLVVRHTCDNRKCFRPDHLVLGTHKQNSDDKWERGRASAPPVHRGLANPRARAITFRGQRKCLREWAVILGVSPKTLARRLAAGWKMGGRRSLPATLPAWRAR